jgi:hypothetical protein
VSHEAQGHRSAADLLDPDLDARLGGRLARLSQHVRPAGQHDGHAGDAVLDQTRGEPERRGVR